MSAIIDVNNKGMWELNKGIQPCGHQSKSY